MSQERLIVGRTIPPVLLARMSRPDSGQAGRTDRILMKFHALMGQPPAHVIPNGVLGQAQDKLRGVRNPWIREEKARSVGTSVSSRAEGKGLFLQCSPLVRGRSQGFLTPLALRSE